MMWIEVHTKGHYFNRWEIEDYDAINCVGLNLEQKTKVKERLIKMFVDRFWNNNKTILSQLKDIQLYVVIEAKEKDNSEPNYLYHGEPI